MITPQKLMSFEVGDTLMLGNDVTDPLTLKVERNPKFKGFPGVSRGNKAIQITEVIEREG
jgi:flagellar motor switch protein FliM